MSAGYRSITEPFRPGTSQKVDYTGTAGTISNGVGAYTRHVRVTVDSAAYVAVAKSPTATASDMYLPADTPVVLTIGAGEKVSAVQVSANGTLYVTELTQ